MRVIEPHQLRRTPRRSVKQRFKRLVVPVLLVAILLSALALGSWRYHQPLPAFTFTETEQHYSQKEHSFTWPEQGQSAVGAVGFGVLGVSSQDTKPMPTASLAKIITALVILDKKPLQLDEQGETITLTIEDEEIYHRYLAEDGSVSAVTAGEALTQYQALQALLLPSSNNMAETLTNWAFGSQTDYIRYANDYVKKLGLTQTTVADSSGFSAQTVSTPHDLVFIGIAALQNPVIAQIVQQEQADVPLAGTIYNTNRLLGQSGINGIKTGNTNEAGGCYLVSAVQHYDNGQSVTTVAAIMGTPTLTDAMNQSKPLLAQTRDGFGDTVVATAGQQFGSVKTAWGSQAAVVVKKDVSLFGWKDGAPMVSSKLESKAFAKGARLGEAEITFGTAKASVELVQNDGLAPPTAQWRLFRR